MIDYAAISRLKTLESQKKNEIVNNEKNHKEYKNLWH